MIDLINLEQLYHELENSYYELQQTLRSLSDEKEYVIKELEEQKTKRNQLEVCGVSLSLLNRMR